MSDLIEREDAIKAVNRAKAEGMTECPTYYLGTIPSADLNSEFSEWARHWFKDSADRPHGEWICHEGRWIDFDYYPTKYECNQCHHYVDVASDKNFCPNCGADMRSKIVGKHADFMMIDEACMKGADDE